MKLIFATQNQHKRDEVKAIMENKVEILSLADLHFHQDLPETHFTLEDNAAEKAEFIYEHLGMNCFSEDTGLEIKALLGEPGVFSARYAGEGKNAADNIALVLEKMKGQPDRSARFRTVVCLIIDKEKYFFEGTVNGTILTAGKGDFGFGYDPVFMPYESNKSFAEMTTQEKNLISHRRRAIEKMNIFLEKRAGTSDNKF